MKCSWCELEIFGISKFIFHQGKIAYHFCSAKCIRKFSELRE